MIILLSKERFLRANFIEYSFGKESEDFLPDFELFKKLNSIDQYYIASHYNWDDGITVLHWIIDSPKCDSGTACMIFWNAEPDYYAAFNTENVNDWDRGIFELLQKIITRFKANGFKKNKLKFNLLENGYNPAVLNSPYPIWELPTALKNGTKGFTPISLGGIQSMIWTYQRNRRLKKREKRKRARVKNK